MSFHITSARIMTIALERRMRSSWTRCRLDLHPKHSHFTTNAFNTLHTDATSITECECLGRCAIETLHPAPRCSCINTEMK